MYILKHKTCIQLRIDDNLKRFIFLCKILLLTFFLQSYSFFWCICAKKVILNSVFSVITNYIGKQRLSNNNKHFSWWCFKGDEFTEGLERCCFLFIYTLD